VREEKPPSIIATMPSLSPPPLPDPPAAPDTTVDESLLPALQAPAAPTPRARQDSASRLKKAHRQAPNAVPMPMVHGSSFSVPEQGDANRQVSAVGVSSDNAGTAISRPAVVPVFSPGNGQRSQSLELAAREADQYTQRGFELASHGAYFAARAQFIQALRLLAQALDTDRHTAEHSRALADGLTAMREAQDFLPSGSRLEADLDIPGIVAGHRTPVLKNASVRCMTPQAALQSYFTFAQTQLGIAGGGELAASMACYGLGKLHHAAAGQQPEATGAALPKSVAFLQASILIHRYNYMASNELGTLLARAGRYEDARTALEHSVSIQSTTTGWNNLAAVYQRTGQRDAAQKASWRAGSLAQQESARGSAQGTSMRVVQWIEPAQFAQAFRPSAAAEASGANVPQSVRLTGYAAPERSALQPAPASQPYSPYPVYPSLPMTQPWTPATPYPMAAVQAPPASWCRLHGWEADRAGFWQGYAQGEYVARARSAHVSEYRMRPDDQLDMIYRLTREETAHPYKLNVGDEVRVESLTDPNLNRELLIQPDGTITLRLLGQVKATGKTITQLRDDLENAFLKYYKVPAISVTPLKMNTKLEDLRATVDRRAGIGGQSQLVRVTPEGTISLPAIGSVPALGLTLRELQQELNERYREQIEGMEVIPVLVQRAARFIYVLGEVRTPGRFELVGPTTVIQSIGMAGGWNVGANLRQVVVFRRDDAWQLVATMLNLQAPLYGKDACPPGEIWLSDSDVVIVPKGKILIADEFIDLVFTRGIYGVFPFSTALNFSNLSRLQ